MEWIALGIVIGLLVVGVLIRDGLGMIATSQSKLAKNYEEMSKLLKGDLDREKKKEEKKEDEDF